MFRTLLSIAVLILLCLSLFVLVLAAGLSYWLVALGAAPIFAGSLWLTFVLSEGERKRREAIRWAGYDLEELVVKTVEARARHEMYLPTPPNPSHFQRTAYGPFGSTHIETDSFALSSAWQMYSFAMQEAMKRPQYFVSGYDYSLTFEEYPDQPLKVFSKQTISAGERFRLRIKRDESTRAIVDYAFV